MTTAVHRTTCSLDCPDTCELEVTVTNGKLTKIDGAADNPHTAGFICGKVRNFDRHLYAPERLRYPMKRTGAKGEGKFTRIGWDEAIDTIGGRLGRVRDQWGGEAILPYHYGGSNGLLSEELLDDLFFCRLGASRLEKTICAAPTTAAVTELYGKMPGASFSDFAHARFILIWGANPKATNIHLIPFLNEAKKNGAFIATVDPMQHFSDDKIDLHLPVRPGTDLVVALAMIRHWQHKGMLDQAFVGEHTTGMPALSAAAARWKPERAEEVSGVPAADIIRLADVYANSSPALLRLGWGMERNVNGARAAAAVLAMPALLGKFGERGGGYLMSNSGASKLDTQAVLGDLEWKTRKLNMTPLANHLTLNLEPPIKALFVYNNNPVATCPDQNRLIEGLKREDLFTVVHEQVHTDTCDYADIVLPATTFLEHHELKKAYGRYVVGGIRPVLEPVGEARSNHDLFAALGRAMGFTDEAFNWDEATALRKLASAMSLNNEPADVEQLVSGKQQEHSFEGGSPVQFKNIFPGTSDGKVHLAPAALGEDPYRFTAVMDPVHPLSLITPASGKLITSTFGQFNLSKLTVTLHPEEAERRGLTHGQEVRVFNKLGEVICPLSVSRKLARGTAMMPKGAWRKSSLNGATGGALCPTTLEPVSGGACFNDARVEIAAR
ncbi:MAG: molybdopterin-dependent oxidoreductase [Acidobacteriota bacterium]|nr:molybdopterin-dependent oxidoreductase [Acidobacteriota bacterium]